MDEKTLLAEFSKRGLLLERGISIKYAPEYDFFNPDSVEDGEVSYSTADGENEIIFRIFNNAVENVKVSGPNSKRIKELYLEIESEHMLKDVHGDYGAIF